MLAKYTLILQTEPEVGKEFPLEKESLTIGRDHENDIVINHPEVSRKHCQLTFANGNCAVQDLGSLNGTFLDGEKITGNVPFYPGVLLGIGRAVSAVLQVTVASTPEPAQPRASLTGMEKTLLEPIEELIPDQEPVEDIWPEEEPESSPTGLFGNEVTRSLLIALAVLLLCIIVGLILFLWFIDTYALWCQVLPFLFEPGVCP